MSEIVRKAEQDLRWSAYPRFLAELMILKLVYLDSTVSLESLMQMIGSDGTLPHSSGASKPNNASDDQKKKV
jgi:hypothetical protein